MAIETYILIITLNVSGLNVLTKRHGLTEWIQKQDLYICCLQETQFRSRDTYRLKVKGWKKANGNQNKARVAILISGKIDFKIKTEAECPAVRKNFYLATSYISSYTHPPTHPHTHTHTHMHIYDLKPTFYQKKTV